MSIGINILFLIVGFTLLVLGADGLVDGASNIAKRFHISDFVIGLTIVAFGTSAPELVVNIVSAIEGSTEIAITNVLGSNIMNVFIILGITSMVYPITSTADARRFDIPMAALAGLAVLLMVLMGNSSLMWYNGAILLLIFCIYMIITYFNGKKLHDSTPSDKHTISVWRSVVYVIAGLGALVGGGELIVNGAVNLARAFGVSEAVIGVTIVALGTSLPELATSVVAAMKHNSDIALGNVIGSNIFNVFLILGLSACIHPLPPYAGIRTDAVMTLLAGVLVWLCVMSNKEHQIKRWHGALLLAAYAAYFTVRIVLA